MYSYTLNAKGQAAIDAFVAEHAKPGCNGSGWYEEAEMAVQDDGWSHIEVGIFYSLTGRPHVLDLSPDCFDKTEVE